jgi:hypothetical protein
MKCVILENLLTTTKIESLPFFDLGKPKTKSIEISTQGTNCLHIKTFMSPRSEQVTHSYGERFIYESGMEKNAKVNVLIHNLEWKIPNTPL